MQDGDHVFFANRNCKVVATENGGKAIRSISDTDANAELQDAYNEYDRQASQAWCKPQESIPSHTSDNDSHDSDDMTVDRAYSEYDQEAANAWRSA